MLFSRNPPGPNTSRIDGFSRLLAVGLASSPITIACPSPEGISSTEEYSRSGRWTAPFVFASEGLVAEFVERFAKTHLLRPDTCLRIRTGI
jgi:hypothetical protein